MSRCEGIEVTGSFPLTMSKLLCHPFGFMFARPSFDVEKIRNQLSCLFWTSRLAIVIV